MNPLHSLDDSIKDLKDRLEKLGRLLEVWWLRSALWVVAAAITGIVASLMFVYLQYRNARPPTSIVVAVHAPSGTASVQYAVLDGFPFVRVRYPDDTTSVLMAPLWVRTSFDDEPERGAQRFFGNTPIDLFFENIYNLFVRWVEERSAYEQWEAGLPRGYDPFPENLRLFGQLNVPFCVILHPGRGFDFLSHNEGLTVFGDNADEMRWLEIRTGTGVFYRFEPQSDVLGKNYRDLWCRLHLPAMAQTLSERSIEIVNGIEESAKGAVQLKVESPLIEPQWGGQARNVIVVNEDVDPESLNGTLPSGGASLVTWDDGGSSGNRDFLLIVVGALYGLAAAMGLEALRPLFEKSHGH